MNKNIANYWFNKILMLWLLHLDDLIQKKKKNLALWIWKLHDFTVISFEKVVKPN